MWATGLLVRLLLQWTTFYYFILNVMFVYRDVFHLCGVFSTISMFMVNSVSNGLLRGEGFTEGICGSVGARIWFFMGFMMGFISFIGSCYILFGEYVHGANVNFSPDSTYPGVAFFIQNLFILVSSIIYRFARTEDMWG